MTTPTAPTCIVNAARTAQLILRDPTGAESIVLDVLGPNAAGQGIQVLQGIKNLYAVPRENVVESGAYEEGGQIGDYPRVQVREAEMTIRTRGANQAELELVETLLWSVLSVRWDCFWRQFDSAGRWRETKVRLKETQDFLGDNLIGQDHHADWKVKLLSGDPFWYSEITPIEFTRRDMTKVAGTTNTWRIDVDWSNPADERCFPQFASGIVEAPEQWTLPDGDGRFDAYTAPTENLIGQPVTQTLPMLPVTATRFLVDTHPLRPTLRVQDRSQQWARMRGANFSYWLEPSTPAPRTVTLTLTGGTINSRLGIYLQQRWDRPFGGQLLQRTVGDLYPATTVFPGAGIYPGVLR